MNRTAAILGLASATLVGAFLLVPRRQVRDEPPPAPSGNAVTHLVYGDGVVQVTARLDRAVVGNTSEPVYLDVALTASGVQTRAPLTAVLVIDRSGSMAGDKIEQARMAAERFVRGLRDEDALAIVTYGSDATLDFPLTALADRAARQQALSVVQRIQEEGGTNIDGGLKTAGDVLAQADLKGRVGRVILVSDGRPTEGERHDQALIAHGTRLRSMSVTTSTIGVGVDYNEDLMEAIATTGGGRYHYLKDGSNMGQILDDELKHGAAIVAVGTTVYLPRTYGAFRIVDAPGAVLRGSDTRVAIDVGDLAAQETRHVLFKLDANNGSDNTLIAPSVTYKKAGDAAGTEQLIENRADAFRVTRNNDVNAIEASRDPAVRVRVLQVETSVAMTQSMQDFARGDVARAKRVLQDKHAELARAAAATQDASAMAEAKNVESTINAITAAPAPASAAAQDLMKAQKARAFTQRR